MRRFRKLIPPIAIGLLLLAYGVAQNIIASEFWARIENEQLRYWVVGGLFPFAVLFAVGYALWERWHPEEGEEAGEHPWRMRQRLADRVLEFAQAQFDGGLYALARNEFDLAERPLAVTDAADQLLAVNVEAYYRSHPGPLVILGQAGTGKTTLLYELATGLCSGRDADAIPVPFGLSHWAVRGEPLEEWMVSELRRSYGVGKALARSWVEKEVVVPFLDGLDEVPAGQRAACAGQIDEYRRRHPEVKFVVTCREAEFGDVKERIGVTSAIVARTLRREQVAEFLDAHATKLGGLREALRAEPALWEVMDTPLMLWVGAFAFESGEGGLGEGGPVRARLFDRYVDAMLKRERGSGAFGVAEAKRWLGQTAACLSRAGLFSFHLEDLSVRWLPAGSRPAAVWVRRLVFGLAIGVFFGLLWLAYGLAFGMGIGLVAGLVAGLVGLLPDRVGPTDGISWLGTGAPPLVVWLVCGLVIGLVVGPGVQLVMWLVFWLGLGLVPTRVQKRTAVNSGLKRSAMFAVLAATPTLMLAVGYVATQSSELRSALAAFASPGVALSMTLGGGFCIHNINMRVMLACRKYIPWRYERFLYFATDRVLLIRQGGSFRFIHRMLQEHLAAQADPSS